MSEENFRTLSAKLQAEQLALNSEYKNIMEQTQDAIGIDSNIDEFIELCKKALPVKELAEDITHAFLDTVYIHDAPKIGRSKEMIIDIHFNFIGKVKFFN